MTRGGFTMPVSYEVIGDTDDGEHLFAWAGDAKAAAELAEKIKDGVIDGTVNAWNVRTRPLGDN